MPEETNRSQSLNTFFLALGAVILGLGGGPVMNLLGDGTFNGRLVPYIIASVVGLVFLGLGAFWHPRSDTPNKLIQRLAQWASSPVPYAVMFLLVWVYFETLAIQSNNEIIGLRNDVQSIARVVDRGVLPRHLDKRQQTAISSFLLQFEPHEYAFQLSNRDQEAGGYRSDIEQALIKGGWTRSAQNPYDYTEDVPEGLTTNFIQTMEHSQKAEDLRNPRADRLLTMALGLAGVRFDGASSGGGSNITEDRLAARGESRKFGFVT